MLPFKRYPFPTTPTALRIYIAGPLGAKTKEERSGHIELADNVGRELFIQGHIPFVPHTQSAAWFADERPQFKDYDLLVANLDIPWLLVCDGIWLLPNWEGSRGTMMEVKAAQEAGNYFFDARHPVPDLENPLIRRRQEYEEVDAAFRRERERLILISTNRCQMEKTSA